MPSFTQSNGSRALRRERQAEGGAARTHCDGSRAVSKKCGSYAQQEPASPVPARNFHASLPKSLWNLDVRSWSIVAHSAERTLYHSPWGSGCGSRGSGLGDGRMGGGGEAG